MTSTTIRSQVVEEQAEPAWEIARLFPAQGAWSEADYLLLPTNHLVEFSHGRVEVLPVPTQSHQLIVLFLYRALYEFVTTRSLGTVLIAPLRVRLWPGKIRESDVVFMLAEHAGRRHEAYWEGADLVMEVVSPDDPQRDLVTKRQEYAQAGISEYWIVDPQAQTITVLRLEQDQYVEHGQFGRGMVATLALLEGFEVEVDAVLDAAS
jgi:Uma2 family endonuclease